MQIDDVRYSINEDFKQQTIQIADELDLDELQSAKLLILAEGDAQELDRSPLASAIIRFHRRRQLLLECLRLVLKQSVDDDIDDDVRGFFRELVRLILNVADGQANNGSSYWRRCLSSMADIEKWLQKLTERAQSASILDQMISAELVEVDAFQRATLMTQHESLAAVSSYIIRGGYTTAEDFRFLLPKLKTLDRHDTILIHYIPIVTGLISQLGNSEGSCSAEDARSLHNAIKAGKDTDVWSLRSFYAAIVVWWIAEYSGRYVDGPTGPSVQNPNLESEANDRSTLFMDALKDGAFQFILSVAKDLERGDWYDPAKAGLVSFLLQEVVALPADAAPPSTHIQRVIMDHLQSFVDAFISNMPDTLRKLKIEEDDQRRSRFQRGPGEYELHLERFLIIICYAFQGNPEAAQAFWSDPDGNLFGFLQWAAKRQTTPRVAAFCEMLHSISQTEECADAAHRFLLEEGVSASGKLRRTGSLSWNQVFNELQFYASSIRDKPVPLQNSIYSANLADQIVEPESPIMLESYLRLIAHLCRESYKARDWMINHPSFHLPEVLFQLCSSGVLSRLRACAFTALASLLTSKTREVGESMWIYLDQWISGAASPSSGLPKASAVQGVSAWTEQMIFDSIATSFEEPNAFVSFLNALVAPYPADTALNDALPFPESLGTAYRMPGVDSYVDFAVGRAFAIKSLELQDPVQNRILRLNCLTFIASCLSNFNEDLIVVANKSSIPVDSAINTSSLFTYIRLHPFARVMEWLFNEKVLSALFATAHQDVDEVSNAASDSPLVLSVARSIEVMILLMSLQSTYLDVVRPIVKTQSVSRRPPVANSALASFEDAVINNLSVIVDLGLYCSTGHQELIVASLELLEKLASSRKLILPPPAGFNKGSDRSKIISILERENDSERIARSLVSNLQLDSRDVEAGPLSPANTIAVRTLNFINGCLAALPDRPTVAHLLLGFACVGNTIDVPEDGLFVGSSSLFHTILQLAVHWPSMDQDNFVSWLSDIKRTCLEILRKLWTSPLSSALVMAEMTKTDYLFYQALKQIPVDPNTLFDGKVASDPEFIFTSSAIAFHNLISERSAFYDYVARELRASAKAGMPTLRARIQSALLGRTLMPSGELVRTMSVFDLFDFVELEVNAVFELPQLRFLSGLDFKICEMIEPGAVAVYNLSMVEELLDLRRNELRKTGRLVNQSDEQGLDTEAQHVMLYLHGKNQSQEVAAAHSSALGFWVRLVAVMLESCDFESGAKTSFVLQGLQIILPKLEKSYSDNLFVAVELAGLARTLLHHVDFGSTFFEKGKTSDFANDRLSQLFLTALNGIYSPVASWELRENCYQICWRYLQGISRISSPPPAVDISQSASVSGITNRPKGTRKSPQSARHNLKTVMTAGERLIDVLCDDAYAGSGTCRISALVLLEALVALAMREDSKYMIESFGRLNFVGVLVDGIKAIPQDLREAKAAGKSRLLP